MRQLVVFLSNQKPAKSLFIKIIPCVVKIILKGWPWFVEENVDVDWVANSRFFNSQDAHNSSWLDLLESSCSGDDSKVRGSRNFASHLWLNSFISSGSHQRLSPRMLMPTIHWAATLPEKSRSNSKTPRTKKNSWSWSMRRRSNRPSSVTCRTRNSMIQRLTTNSWRDQSRERVPRNAIVAIAVRARPLADRLAGRLSPTARSSWIVTSWTAVRSRSTMARTQLATTHTSNMFRGKSQPSLWTIDSNAVLHRDQRTRDHPKTPPKHLKYSRRAWEGLIKSWRKKLHVFDPQSKFDRKQDKNDDWWRLTRATLRISLLILRNILVHCNT